MKAKVVYRYQLKSISRGSLKQKQQRQKFFPLPFLCKATVNLVTLEICGIETDLEFLRPSAEQGGDTECSNVPHVQEALNKNIHSAVDADYEKHNKHSTSFAHQCWSVDKREMFMLLFAHCISSNRYCNSGLMSLVNASVQVPCQCSSLIPKPHQRFSQIES